MYTRDFLLKFFVVISTVKVFVVNCDTVYINETADDVSVVDSPPTAGVDYEIFKHVKSFVCSMPSVNNSELMLQGSRVWSFPEQDVQLTVVYPTENLTLSHLEDYLITSVQLIVSLDGGGSCACYIDGGGLMRNNIKVKLECTSITKLGYKFFLYGKPGEDLPNMRLDQLYGCQQ